MKLISFIAKLPALLVGAAVVFVLYLMGIIGVSWISGEAGGKIGAAAWFSLPLSVIPLVENDLAATFGIYWRQFPASESVPITGGFMRSFVLGPFELWISFAESVRVT